MLTCTFGFAIDVGEIAIASAMGAVFSSPSTQDATPTFALSSLLASTYVGAAIGAFGFGLLARRWSTCRALALAMVLLGLASFAGAFSSSMYMLTVMRGLSGLGIGAFPPLAIALLATQLPARLRARSTLTATAVGSLGGPLVIFVARHFTLQPLYGLDGWRVALILWSFAAILAGVTFWAIRDCERPAKTNVPNRPSAHKSSTENAYVSLHRIVLPAVYFIVQWSAVGFPVLSGIFLLEKGMELPDALLLVLAMKFGPSLSALLSGFVLDRIARRDAVIWSLLFSALFLAMFGIGDNPGILGATSVLFTMAMSLHLTLINLYSAEVFKAEISAAATSRLWSINRISGAVAPLFLLPMLYAAGPFLLTIFLGVTLALCAGLLLLAPRNIAREDLN